jgi:hypothetical protein
MKYALERYNQLVNARLNPNSIENANLDGDHLNEWIEKSSKEKETIKQYLRKKSLKIKREKELELFIQQYQAEVIELLDVVYAEKLENHSGSFGRLFDVLLKDLEEVLSHIERRYNKYFNLDEKAPASYLSMTQGDLRNRIGILKRFIGDGLNNEELIKIVFTPLSEFLELKENVSYRQLMYMKDFVLELEEWRSEKGKVADLRSFLELLFYMNFNVSFMASFLLGQVADSINAIPDHRKRLERLVEIQKEYNQAQVRPGVSFRANVVPLKELVSHWIDEEIYYLEKKQRLLSVPAVVQDQLVAEEDKIHLSCPVDVFALLVRSAKDVKLILNRHMSGTFRSFARFTRTNKAEAPSAKSLLKKTYVADRKAKRAAIEVLERMIEFIKTY